MKKIYIHTTSCLRRMLDAAKFLNYFEINGYEIAKNPKVADYILLNSCAFKKSEEDLSIKKIKEFKKYKGKLIVCGCLPGINPKRLTKIFKGPVFTPSTINKIDEIFNPKIKFDSLDDFCRLFAPHYAISDHLKRIFFPLKDAEVSSGLRDKFRKFLRDEYYLRISWGCLGQCSYCAIKRATGKLKSKPIEKCLEEFRRGVNMGYKNFRIIAEDSGAYGLDINQTLPNLLNRLLKVKSDYNIGIFDFHPKWIIKYLEELIPIIRTKRISEICCPIQSGSERILNLMRRSGNAENAEQIKKALLALKKEYSKLRLILYIIVGFPGETEKDFRETLKFVKEIRPHRVVIFPFHEKPDTLAAKLSNKIPQKIIKKRVAVAYNAFVKSGIMEEKYPGPSL